MTERKNISEFFIKSVRLNVSANVKQPQIEIYVVTLLIIDQNDNAASMTRFNK